MASSQITSFKYTPTQISGCSLWLDGADPNGNATVPGNGASVSTWVDKSGSGNTVSAGSGQPTYTRNISNNLGALSFNGSQGLSKASVAASSLAGNNTTTFSSFVVCSFSNNTQNNIPISWDSPAYTYRIMLQYYAPTPEIDFDFGDANANKRNAISAFTPTNNQLYIYSYVKNGANGSLLVNGGVFSNTSSTLTTTNFGSTSYTLNVGTYVNDPVNFNMKGNTCEIIFFSSALSISQQQQIEGYLAWKWGLQGSLPATHPFKSAAPVGTPSSIPVPMTNSIFRPPQISGCQLWLDGTDVNGNRTVPANGASISTWVDKSGNGTNFTANGTPATYTTTSNALVFNNNRYDSSFSANVTNETLFTVFLPSLNQSMYVLQSSLAGGRGVGTYTSASMYGIVNEDTAWGAISSGLNGTNSVNIGVSVVGSKSNTQVSVNGGSLTAVTTIAAYSAGNTILGKDKLSMYPWRGNIYEIIAYNSVLSTPQIQQVEGYLAWKWGLTSSLPNGHPYKTPPFLPFSYGVRATVQRKWVPTQVSGCVLWLDAADPNGTGVLPASGSAIASWKDKSSNGFTGTALNSPTYQANVQNNLPVIRFNGTNQYINFGNVLNLGTNPLAIFVITKFDTTNETGIIGKTAYTGADMRWALWYGKAAVGSSTTGVQNIYQDNAQSGSSLVSTNPATIGSQYNLYSYFTNRTNFSLNLNGSLAQSATVTGTPTIFSTSYNLLVAAYADSGGVNPRSTMYLNGDIAELLIYFTNQTTAQQQQVEGYLAWKWGLQGNLPSDHPFRYAPPSPP